MGWRWDAFLRGFTGIGRGMSRIGPPPFRKELSPSAAAVMRAWLEVKRHEHAHEDGAPCLRIYLDGATPEQADAFMDRLADWAYDNEPAGVTLTIGATLNPGGGPIT